MSVPQCLTERRPESIALPSIFPLPMEKPITLALSS
jgi:hypothetical protein